jgi:transposase
VVLHGVTTEIKVAQVRLCHSRMLFVRAYPRETQEMVFDAHDKAFAFFRGTCEHGIYDNNMRPCRIPCLARQERYDGPNRSASCVSHGNGTSSRNYCRGG